MNIHRQFPSVKVTQKAELSIRSGHPWVYGEEITSSVNNIINGELTDVFSDKNAYLGTGFFSEKSKIKIRIISRNANETFDEAFFERRLTYAIQYRQTVMKGADFKCCRLIFGEADGMPGLTVDRFDSILVTQVLSYGMDKIKNLIFRLLYKILTDMGEKITGIYERNDVAIRELEGLEQYKAWFDIEEIGHPDSTQINIVENNITYKVDFENGQKTGYFLDQKRNREEIAKLAKGKTVLDCFTHTGSFALNAAAGDAAHVTAVDVSESAIEMAKYNAAKNGLDSRMDFVVADIFELLPKYEIEKKHFYNFIILDPPAFTKSRKTILNAQRGYHEINYRAMKLLPRGGYFATCSCSHFMPDKLFTKMLLRASSDAGVQLRQIKALQQAPDHPILWNVPETDYLKFYIFQII